MSFYDSDLLIYVLLGCVLLAAGLTYSMLVRRKVIKSLSQNSTKQTGLKTSASPLKSRLLSISLVLCLITVGIAILRPINGSTISESRQPSKNIIILFDSSQSMGVTDSEGLSRLEAAKLFSRELINQRTTDRIGLISFDGLAFPECPVTLSRTMLLKRIEIQEAGGLKYPGSDLRVALEESLTVLTENLPEGSAVILLSDGDRLSEDLKSDLAKVIEKNVPVHTIRFGDDLTESQIPDSKLHSKANPALLDKIANSTGGIALVGSQSSLDSTFEKLNNVLNLTRIGEDSDLYVNLQSKPLDLYAYPLVIALTLLMLRLFLPERSPKLHRLAPVIILLCILTFTAKAQEADAPESYKPYAEAKQRALDQDVPLLVIFTGSDWSEASIKFETEIASSQLYKRWLPSAVVPLEVDLPRLGLSNEERTQRRALASRLSVRSFPTMVFLDSNNEELGRLGYDPEGPANWVRRANLIIAGNKEYSTMINHWEKLPKEKLNQLKQDGLTPNVRAKRYYNLALEYFLFETELTTTSSDRFDLLNSLLSHAERLTTTDELDLKSDIAALKAVMLHQRAKKLTPNTEPQASTATQYETDPKHALTEFKTALTYYRKSAKYKPNRKGLSDNLTSLHYDRALAQAFVDYEKSYQEAVEKLGATHAQELRFNQSLERGVTTAKSVNDLSIINSEVAVNELLELAEITKSPALTEIYAALEDIELAMNPHTERGLDQSSEHIKNALDHLVSQQEQRRERRERRDDDNEPDEQDDEEWEDGEEMPEDDSEDQADNQDLRRSESQSGNLRQRQLENLRKGADEPANISPNKLH